MPSTTTTTEPLSPAHSPVPHAPSWALGTLLVLPWLTAYTAGPLANAWPWLVSAFCAALVWLFWRRLDARLIATAWVLAAAVSAVIGLVQYFGLAQVFSPWISQTGAGEAFANLRQRNQFATLTSIGLLALVALLARRAPGLRVPGWMYAAMALLALGNAASSSRTGLLQWLLIVALTAGWALRGQRRTALFALQALLAYGLAVFALPWLLNAATGLSSAGLLGRLAETPGCGSRRVLWSNVLTLIAQKPWLGWGWGELDYAHFITLYPGPRFCEILDNAHNLPLQLAVELGIPAALALCAGAGWWVWRGKPWREADPARQLAWGVLAVILLHSLLEYPLWYSYFLLPAAFAWGMGLAARARQRASRGADTAPSPQRTSVNQALMLGGLLMALGTAWCAYDYLAASNIYSPRKAAGPLEQRIKHGQGKLWFGYQADYADVTGVDEDEPSKPPLAFRRTLHNLLDARLMMAYARSLAEHGEVDKARFVVERLKEFHNSAADEFLAVCDDEDAAPATRPFQCLPPQRSYTWRELLPY
ncbi:MAG: Wzy polymerase domain-containing protein [Polaromonas sp.]|nr:Wzy polymerase domain-containing protein [Polaromonas sp.]